MSGWAEYTLPDNSSYYVHPERHIVADVDLQNPTKLQMVTEYVNNKLPEDAATPRDGWELWLRDPHPDRDGRNLTLVQTWVNHRAHVLSTDPPSAAVREQVRDDDRASSRTKLSSRLTFCPGLDMQYRYWSYIEAHPAHVSLTAESRADALEVLRWSYTGQLPRPAVYTQLLTSCPEHLLPAARPAPPPFAPKECQELMALLRTANDEPTDISLAQNRAIARVLLRHGEYSRANKC